MDKHQEGAVTSSDKIFYRLRSDIIDGAITAGSKLSEPELSTNYGVSRAVIREAINRLAACHIVERKANIGARVVELSAQGLIELYQVRESLEGMAARLAATNMLDSETAQLQSLLVEHEASIAGNQSYYQEAGDVDFHYRIIMGSKNQQLINVLFNGLYHLVRMYRVQLGMAGPRVSKAFQEHRQIADAIANRDGELAEMLMRRHIHYSKNTIEKILASND